MKNVLKFAAIAAFAVAAGLFMVGCPNDNGGGSTITVRIEPVPTDVLDEHGLQHRAWDGEGNQIGPGGNFAPPYADGALRIGANSSRFLRAIIEPAGNWDVEWTLSYHQQDNPVMNIVSLELNEHLMGVLMTENSRTLPDTTHLYIEARVAGRPYAWDRLTVRF